MGKNDWNPIAQREEISTVPETYTKVTEKNNSSGNMVLIFDLQYPPAFNKICIFGACIQNEQYMQWVSDGRI